MKSNRRDMLLLFATIIVGFCTNEIEGQTSVRYSSSCSVPVCGSSSGGSTCVSSTPCYSFRSTNRTICAPQVDCSLFDVCINGSRCSSNLSICIINSCCSSPICMPVALSSSCVSSNSSGSNSSLQTTTPAPTGIIATGSGPVPIAPLSTMTRLCPNATWNQNYSLIAGNTYGNNATVLYNPSDFFLDSNSSIYVSDNGNYRIQKFVLGNPVGTIVANTSPYQPVALYVDGVGAIFSCEQAIGGVTPYGRLQKYVPGNIGGTTLLGGGLNCGTGLTQLCGCGGVYADRQGLLYVSDTPNHRILLYNTTAGSITVLIGTNGIAGSQSNQVNNPRTIYVNENNSVFVYDSGNSRIQKYDAGQAVGVTLGTTSYYMLYYTSGGLTGDSLGLVYYGSGLTIQRVMPGVANTSAIIDGSQTSPGSLWNLWGCRLDVNGSLYTATISMIIRFDLLQNTC